MKKYITLSNLAWGLAFLVPLVIATMLCTACASLQNKTNQKQEIVKDVNVMFAQIEKPL
jgi:uncharacterized protein YcfL